MASWAIWDRTLSSSRCWTMGDVASVSAQLGFNIKRVGADGKPFQMANNSALVTLEFVNGAQAQVGVSAAAHLIGVGMKPTCTLYGEKGTVEGGWQFSDGINRINPYLRAGFDGSEEKINEEVTLEIGELLQNPPGWSAVCRCDPRRQADLSGAV